MAGWLCSTHGQYGGWPAIFYLSAAIGTVILVIWVLLSADKPSKHMCISQSEQEYIARKIEEESIGKRNQRPPPPWKAIFTCVPLYAGVAALICHEYPLVIVLQVSGRCCISQRSSRSSPPFLSWPKSNENMLPLSRRNLHTTKMGAKSERELSFSYCRSTSMTSSICKARPMASSLLCPSPYSGSRRPSLLPSPRC